MTSSKPPTITLSTRTTAQERTPAVRRMAPLLPCLLSQFLPPATRMTFNSCLQQTPP